MFTGLVQHVGRVARREEAAFGARFTIDVGAWPQASTQTSVGPHAPPANAPHEAWSPPLALGESIAVSGCCLTLARIEEHGPGGAGRQLGFDVIHHTLRVTALGHLAVGHRVNLERSATPSTLLGGHIVQGHVDDLGRVEAVIRERGEWRIRIGLSAELARYLHPRGSIAVEGVSLTVAALDDHRGTFDVCLIPETLARSTLGERVEGDAVHLEVDCLAKMLERLVRPPAS